MLVGPSLRQSTVVQGKKSRDVPLALSMSKLSMTQQNLQRQWLLEKCNCTAHVRGRAVQSILP